MTDIYFDITFHDCVEKPLSSVILSDANYKMPVHKTITQIPALQHLRIKTNFLAMMTAHKAFFFGLTHSSYWYNECDFAYVVNLFAWEHVYTPGIVL